MHQNKCITTIVHSIHEIRVIFMIEHYEMLKISEVAWTFVRSITWYWWCMKYMPFIVPKMYYTQQHLFKHTFCIQSKIENFHLNIFVKAMCSICGNSDICIYSLDSKYWFWLKSDNWEIRRHINLDIIHGVNRWQWYLVCSLDF